jgi:hypothetical protein
LSILALTPSAYPAAAAVRKAGRPETALSFERCGPKPAKAELFFEVPLRALTTWGCTHQHGCSRVLLLKRAPRPPIPATFPPPPSRIGGPRFDTSSPLFERSGGPFSKEEHVMPIRQYLHDATFEPDARAMSDALERTCRALGIKDHGHDREVVATRIINLARATYTLSLFWIRTARILAVCSYWGSRNERPGWEAYCQAVCLLKSRGRRHPSFVDSARC